MALQRREVLAGLAVTGALAGCYGTGSVIGQRLPGIPVDGHVHIFNGRDVPVIGFIDQVIYGGHSGDLPAGLPNKSLAVLLIKILRIGTPTAAAELQGLPQSGPEQDQQHVAAALDEFAAEAQADAQQMSMRRAAPDPERNDALLLQMIGAETGLAAPGADMGMASMRRSAGAAPTPDAQIAAAAIYERQEQGRQITYTLYTPLATMLRWAGLLTRRRSDILTEYLRLYGQSGEIKVLFPSMVDLELWLNNPADNGQVSPLHDQVRLMHRIATGRRDCLVVPFVPFCPLRSAMSNNDSPLRLVQQAVQDLGFGGVKLYPPMGFRPDCNNGISFAHSRAPAGMTGARIDEQLHRLYGWCQAEEVPIQAHANDSMAAGPGTGAYASPEYWGHVLDRYPGLRVNLSHAGIFATDDRAAPPNAACGISGARDWGRIVAELVSAHDGLYFDTGYWTDPAFLQAAATQMQQRLAAFTATHPRLPARMIYGSDWTMIGRETHHPAYLVRMGALIDQIFPDPANRQAITGDNAIAFLLGPGDKRRARLGAVHGANPIWRQIARA